MNDELMDMYKHSANQTLAQSRRDLEAIAKRMQALEGDNPASNDCYHNIVACLLNTVNRIEQVLAVGQRMALREATGIRPELN